MHAHTLFSQHADCHLLPAPPPLHPQAFPNPSENVSPRPPVLAAAEGDEHLGCNANQFADVDASCRQALIDAKSPAQATGK